MEALETKYMGLELKNPLIVGSCGLTGNVDQIKELEKAGAGAVVLKSIFEEQIMQEAHSLRQTYQHTEEQDYITNYIKNYNLDNYFKLIKEAKQAVDIPVIASINCSTPSEWVNYITRIQDHGADAIELNIFMIPGKIEQDGREIEQIYFDIVRKVKKVADVPISIKLSNYFSGFANFVSRLSSYEIDGLVLFNRFYKPDIDIDKMEFVSGSRYSTAAEMSLPLRWIGILAGKVKTDFAASTGVHNGKAVIKCLLAGANVVQIVSTLYKNGIEEIETILAFITDWLEHHKYDSIRQITGKLNQSYIKDPSVYERAQFMKYFHKG